MKSLRDLLIIFATTCLVISCSSDSTSAKQSIQPLDIDTILINNIYANRFELESTIIADAELVDHLNQPIRLTEIAREKTIMIFFFSEVSCFDCVSKQLGYIAIAMADSLEIPLIVINTSQNLRSAYAVMKEKGLDLPYYSTIFQNLGFDRNQHPGPLFFILDDELRCKFSYEPIIQIPKSTIHYLHIANKLFFSREIVSNTNH